MYRCLLAAGLVAAFVAPADAQVQRQLPPDSLRGVIVVTDPPQITLNRQVAMLSPGARIRDAQNMQQLSGSLVGQRLLANYTLDSSGQVSAVWVLTVPELQKRWPETRQQAAAWVFDPVAQTWSKP